MADDAAPPAEAASGPETTSDREAEAAAAEGTGDANDGGDPDATYGGVLGAYPYAFRASDSRLFRSYAVVGGLLALAATALFAFAVVDALAVTFASASGSISFAQAFVVLIALFVVAPLVAPVLFVARRHRRGAADARFDAAQAALGYLLVGALYVAAVVSTPGSNQEAVSSGLVLFLYALPRAAGLAVPLLVAVTMALVARSWE